MPLIYTYKLFIHLHSIIMVYLFVFFLSFLFFKKQKKQMQHCLTWQMKQHKHHHQQHQHFPEIQHCFLNVELFWTIKNPQSSVVFHCVLFFVYPLFSLFILLTLLWRKQSQIRFLFPRITNPPPPISICWYASKCVVSTCVFSWLLSCLLVYSSVNCTCILPHVTLT